VAISLIMYQLTVSE